MTARFLLLGAFFVGTIMCADICKSNEYIGGGAVIPSAPLVILINFFSADIDAGKLPRDLRAVQNCFVDAVTIGDIGHNVPKQLAVLNLGEVVQSKRAIGCGCCFWADDARHMINRLLVKERPRFVQIVIRTAASNDKFQIFRRCISTVAQANNKNGDLCRSISRIDRWDNLNKVSEDEGTLPSAKRLMIDLHYGECDDCVGTNEQQRQKGNPIFWLLPVAGLWGVGGWLGLYGLSNRSLQGFLCVCASTLIMGAGSWILITRLLV
jgi:hypothetical protein